MMMARLKKVSTDSRIALAIFSVLAGLALWRLDDVHSWLFGKSSDGTSSKPVWVIVKLGPSQRQAAQAMSKAYLTLSEKLASDDPQGAKAAAKSLAARLRALAKSLPAGALQGVTKAQVKHAERLASTAKLSEQRNLFLQLSVYLAQLAQADSGSFPGLQGYHCPMFADPGIWLQERGTPMRNPYMGKAMLECGNGLERQAWPRLTSAASAGASQEEYTCPMHPGIAAKKPGPCPLCGMDLVLRGAAAKGAVVLRPTRRKQLGIRTAKVTKRRFGGTLERTGALTAIPSKTHDITLKYRGFINHVYATKVGKKLKRGAPLFSVYSHEVYTAQGDYLAALALEKSAIGGPKSADGRLLSASKRRLGMYDASGLTRYLKKRESPVRYLTIGAPIGGVLLESHVVDGSGVAPGQRIMRMADLSKLWAEVELYPGDFRGTEGIESATLRLADGSKLAAKPDVLAPTYDGRTRTRLARFVVENKHGKLAPQQYVTLEIHKPQEEGLWVPDSAVIYGGKRSYVFVAKGEKLTPRAVRLGGHYGEHRRVVAGLTVGEEVVSRGVFLVAAESRLSAAMDSWGAEDEPPAALEPPRPTNSAPAVAPKPAPKAHAKGAHKHGRATPKPRKTKPAPAKHRHHSHKHVHGHRKAGPTTSATPNTQKPPAASYVCPMHPSVRSSKPGRCPKCGMFLRKRKAGQ